jgi:hypothetical protein
MMIWWSMCGQIVVDARTNRVHDYGTLTLLNVVHVALFISTVTITH